MNLLKMHMGENKEEFYMERTQRNHYFLGGESTQLKIRDLKIAVAGVGGMGSNIAESLARLGVGELRIADPDTIDLSNINRQVIANTKTIGKRKADASRDEINIIAPDTKIISYPEGVNEEMVENFVKGCDFIVDEIDVFPIEAHGILHRAARKYNIPVYSAYVVGLGIHFYKFQGNEFTFEDFLSCHKDADEKDKFDEIVKAVAQPMPSYLEGGQRLDNFKKMATEKGVPIFGPSTLIGHSMVVTRILCDFLGSEILGVSLPKTPVMPKFVKVDFATFEMSTETYENK